MHDKIEKLLALAKDPAATEAEADTAMRMANALMMKYGIEEVTPSSTIDQVRVTINPKIDLPLVSAVGDLFGVYNYYTRGTDQAYFVGERTMRDAAVVMFNYLVASRERQYKVFLPRGLPQSDRAEFRRTFKYAFGLRIYRRVQEIVREMRTNDRVAIEATGSRALVVADSIDQRLNELRKWTEQTLGAPMRQGKTRSRKAGMGTAAGRAAADATPIRREIN